MQKRLQTDKPFGEALAEVLAAKGLSQRALAELVGVEQSHLSRLSRRADSRLRPSVELAAKITVALDLPEGFFRETREAAVIERIRTDPRLLNRVYRNLKKDG